MKESFFEKLGKSLKLDDEKFDVSNSPALSSQDDEEEDVDAYDAPEQDLENNDTDISSSEDVNDDFEEENMESPEENENEEDALLAEDNTPRINLALARAKTKTLNKPARKIKLHSESSYQTEEGRLTIDVYEKEDAIVIKSTIAGVDPDELDIDITSDSVTIRGERQKDETVKEEDYFYQECYWGVFSRSVILPTEIDPDKADAVIQNGILTITLPKLSKSQQKKIKVKRVS